VRGATYVPNSRAATKISNLSAATEVSTSDSEYPAQCTRSEVTHFCHAKDDEGNKGEATIAMEVVVQGNKGQATIETTGNCDAG
jgi:hypothetical protein